MCVSRACGATSLASPRVTSECRPRTHIRLTPIAVPSADTTFSPLMTCGSKTRTNNKQQPNAIRDALFMFVVVQANFPHAIGVLGALCLRRVDTLRDDSVRICLQLLVCLSFAVRSWILLRIVPARGGYMFVQGFRVRYVSCIPSSRFLILGALKGGTRPCSFQLPSASIQRFWRTCLLGDLRLFRIGLL